jgi:4-amino-4-deoxy-L-arabinose transferase-like glycosyltransferase
VKTTPRESPATLAILAVLVLAGLGLRIGYAVEQPATPPPDAEAYARIAENLYGDGSFDARPEGVAHEVQPSSAYSPGLPLFVAGIYWLSGGVHLTLALILLAILGTGAIPLTYLLGRRFAGPAAGLIAAGVVAIYPALLEYQGLLLTEPLAATLLTGSLALFLSAAERSRGTAERTEAGVPWAWLGTGALFGLLALVRPEYLPLALGLPLVWLAREALRRVLRPYRDKVAAQGWLGSTVAPVALSLLATVLVILPWTIHNAVELDRFVPISTGGGKALFIGTDLEAGGDSVQLREELLTERPALRARLEAEGAVDDPGRMVLERLLEWVAAESYPDMETDAALSRLGRQNLEDGVTEEPLRFAGMMASKSYDAWTDAARGVMLDQPWRTLQLAIVLLALAGLAILALGRRRFEALVAGLVLLYMTAVAALLIASPRRELVVLPLLTALAGASAVEIARRLRRPARG